MRFLEIKVGKSLNQNTGEEWWKADALVSVDDSEDETEVFKKVKNIVDGWIPNQMKQNYNNEPSYFNVTTRRGE